MVGDSCSEGCGFEFQYHILDGHFSHLFVVKIAMFVWKDENKRKRGRYGPLLKNSFSSSSSSSSVGEGIIWYSSEHVKYLQYYALYSMYALSYTLSLSLAVYFQWSALPRSENTHCRGVDHCTYDWSPVWLVFDSVVSENNFFLFGQIQSL